MAYRAGTGDPTRWDPVRRQWRRKISNEQRNEISFRLFEGAKATDLALEFNLSASYIRTMSPIERPHG